MSGWGLLSKLKAMCKSQKPSWVAFREALISFRGRADLTEWQIWDLMQSQSFWEMFGERLLSQGRSVMLKSGPWSENWACKRQLWTSGWAPRECCLCRSPGTFRDCRGGQASLVRAGIFMVFEDTKRRSWKGTGFHSPEELLPPPFFIIRSKTGIKSQHNPLGMW